MEYLDGKNLQKKFLTEIKEFVSLLGIKPVLAIISIGENKANTIFFKQIKKMTEFVGYEIEYYHYEDISLNTLLELINKLNKDPKITSIMIELPIPKHLPLQKVRNTILPTKDIEGMNDKNKIKLKNGEGGYLPNTVLGTIMLLENYAINICKKNVVIINRSETIGIPLAQYFLKQDCTVTVCHSQTSNLEDYIKNADIVVTATGNPHFLSDKQFKENSTIIDIGINYLNGNLCGDVALSDEQNSKIKYFAKSIGGVGPMTITALAYSILKSYYITKEDIDNDKS